MTKFLYKHANLIKFGETTYYGHSIAYKKGVTVTSNSLFVAPSRIELLSKV